MTIHKHKIEPGTTIIQTAVGSKVLHVGLQNTCPFVWIIFDEKEERKMSMKIVAKMTGERFESDGNMKHIGTVIMDDIHIVAHLFLET